MIRGLAPRPPRAIVTTAIAVAACLAVVAAPRAAGAGPRTIELADQPARLTVDDAWQDDAPPAGDDAPVLVLRRADGARLTVTIAMAANADAWRKKKRKAYLADVVAGFAAQPGVTVDEHHERTVAGVPTLDLRLTRKVDGGRETVAVRLLLFRTRTIAAAAAAVAPGRALRKVLTAAATGLAPKHAADPSR
ncbi:MAG: hypothetical protein H6708_25975 [Kofleriaceae bacterium]|nr:hypothetical protein [Kofleriaceae bacterium]